VAERSPKLLNSVGEKSSPIRGGKSGQTLFKSNFSPLSHINVFRTYIELERNGSIRPPARTLEFADPSLDEFGEDPLCGQWQFGEPNAGGVRDSIRDGGAGGDEWALADTLLSV